MNAPASTIATIIGPKGATLKEIRDKTNVKVDIPRKETIAEHSFPGQGEEEEEVSVPITISGSQPLVLEAQAMLKAIIATKTSKTTQRVRGIPEHILPFVLARRAEFLAEAEGAQIELKLNAPEREITASGDREAVVKVVEKIKVTVKALEDELTTFTMSLPKRQHRLLAGRAASDEIMAKSKCSVVLPRPEEPSDQIIVYGNPNDLPNGMAAIMQKANSQYIHEFPLPGPIAVSKQIVVYMTKIGYPKTLSSAHEGVAVFTPPTAALKSNQSLNVDIAGEKSAVDAAVAELSTFVANLLGGTKEVEIDWLVHRVLIGKYAKKCVLVMKCTYCCVY